MFINIYALYGCFLREMSSRASSPHASIESCIVAEIRDPEEVRSTWHASMEQKRTKLTVRSTSKSVHADTVTNVPGSTIAHRSLKRSS